MRFSKDKFLSFPEIQRHKKCAEILRGIYSNPTIEALEHYQELLTWQDTSLPPIATLEEIANRYHWHLELAGQRHREHNLLPQKKDTVLPILAPLPIAIYLDHIRSAHNVGSIIRTTEALALGKIYFSPQTPTTENKQVRDASMDTWQWVESDAKTPLSELPRPIIALEITDDAVDIYTFEFPPSFTLVIGNEEVGCSAESLQMADVTVKIPLYGRKHSLNVANAFAIVGSLIRQKQR